MYSWLLNFSTLHRIPYTLKVSLDLGWFNYLKSNILVICEETLKVHVLLITVINLMTSANSLLCF